MDLPIPRKLTLIVGLFCVVVFSLLALSYAGMEILSGSRAYVGGEGLWSKAQKGAVYRLTRYALFYDEADYRKYLQHIAIPLGDHQARLELSKPEMNFERVLQGFVQGRNHPADVRTMAWMARNLHPFRYMGSALRIWGDADHVIEGLPPVADSLHREISSGHPSRERIKTLIDKIAAIDARLTPLEDDFSYTLGAGARWLKAVLLAAMILTTGVFLAATLLIAFWISKHLCLEIEHLRVGAARIAGGDYALSLHIDAKDEIGDLARSFQQMATQRQHAEKTKDEFFANVSHELRTPLTLILSPLESLLSGDHGPMDPRAEPFLKTMHNNTVRLLQLVNGLLDFSKLSAGQLHVEREPVKIAELTDTLYKDFQPMMQQKNIQGSLETTPADALVMMDRYLYERIFFNLLSNAIKFTPSGGRIEIRAAWSDNQWVLSILDTGIGISHDDLQHLFQRFRQVEGSSTRRFEGTGLGLALVKELTELLGGRISVKSIPGQGSTFTVVCSAPAAQNVSVPNTPERAFGRMKVQQYNTLPPEPASQIASQEALPKVLIAEDNAEMASYVTSLLQPFCLTRIARNGDDALQEAQAWSPDLLLTDVMMPGRDGLSLCRDMKADPATAAIPIIMLTALTHREALLEGWKAGANEYLFKPFHPRELVTRVQSLLKAVQDQKRAQEKITDLNEHLRLRAMDLAISNQELEAFSYSVSHDLRTPLRAIEGFTQELLTQSETQLGPRGQEDLHRIASAVRQMEHLIDDLLELSHISRSELKLEKVDLSACVHAIVQEITVAHPAHTVRWNIAPGVSAQGDPRLLQIALTNLLQNAWKFSQKQPRPEIEFGVSEKAGNKVFFVKDNGVGFDMTYSGELFTPFHRLHKPSDFPGTGLGLALVARIIHRHGGRVWAEGKENAGAAFYFTLLEVT